MGDVRVPRRTLPARSTLDGGEVAQHSHYHMFNPMMSRFV